MRDNNEEIVLIDYEYGGWNVFVWDIANYFNEMVLDNAHPKGNGVKVYLSNFPNKDEREQLCKYMLKIFYDEHLPAQDKQKFTDFSDYWN